MMLASSLVRYSLPVFFLQRQHKFYFRTPRKHLNMDEVLHFKNRQEWRAWLSHNHKNSRETWVYISKKKAKNPALPYEEAVEEALCFGWIDGIIKKGDSEKFPQRFAPRRGDSIWSVSVSRS